MVKKLSIIGLTLIAFLLLAAKPTFAAGHSYGQTKHAVVNSHTQGKSKSDPDDNGKGPERSNGGYDKPGYTGGINSDRDGNNGCGNDSDREDDNEGWCGSKPKKTKVENSCDKTCQPKEDKDHNGCDKVCNQVCKPAPKPTPKPIGTPVLTPLATPVVTKTPTVLGITTLPNTASPSKPDYSIYAVALLLLSGVELHLLANKVK